ncbi:purine permease 1-like [Aristolochia californica]|uniref:purine permease 1-like n=1 Tax=Aristolochia californica TaxID=171875 RepID=UPI0035E12A7C
MATMSLEKGMEEGSVSPCNIRTFSPCNIQPEFQRIDPSKKRRFKFFLLGLNCILTGLGTTGGPLLLRLYYLHGGQRQWTTSWLQTAGFPILLIPLSILYIRDRARGVPFMAEPKLLMYSAGIGLLVGLDNFMYSHGLSFLPVSTSALLFSTQLAFTAFFAFVIVKQKFSPYSVNAVVLMTLGAVLLGVRKSGDRPANVTSGEYLVGFLLTLGAALLLGFIFPSIEFAYSKASKTMTHSVVLQFQFGVTLFATIFCTIGMLINKDFQAIGREAENFGLGEVKYYLILVAAAVVFQMEFVGWLGVVFCASSFFAGVLGAALLPITEIAAVIAFNEKFTPEKGMSLALCLWGFTSYFYGANKSEKKVKAETEAQQPENI